MRGDRVGDPTRSAEWEWGYAERASTGLYEFSLGVDGSAHLDSAALLLGAS